MTSARTQLKIGLLLMCAIAAALAIAIVLRLNARPPVTRYHTYFDESVAGLDIGSVVQFRGIRIGVVGAIGIAPDRRLVDVVLELDRDDAAKIGLPDQAAMLRTRLETSGITGVKYIDLDPSTGSSAPALAFAPPRAYIPSRPSFLRSLEGRVDDLGEKLPVLVEHATAVVDDLGGVIADLRQQQLVARIGEAADHAEHALAAIDRLVRRADRAGLADRAGAVLDHVDAAVTKVRGWVSMLQSDGKLEHAMDELGGAAREFRQLVQEVQREPDMLVKGRARTGRL
jgi:ABC-type transporter Mla subunit MlaD